MRCLINDASVKLRDTTVTLTETVHADAVDKFANTTAPLNDGVLLFLHDFATFSAFKHVGCRIDASKSVHLYVTEHQSSTCSGCTSCQVWHAVSIGKVIGGLGYRRSSSYLRKLYTVCTARIPATKCHAGRHAPPTLAQKCEREHEGQREQSTPRSKPRENPPKPSPQAVQ